MKKHTQLKPFVSRSMLFAGGAAALCLAAPSGMAQSVIFGSGPVSPVFNLPVVNGVNATLQSEISVGFFAGIGTEYLYQYAITDVGGPNLQGFNMNTASFAAVLAGGNIANNSIALATAAPGNLLAASAPDVLPVGALGGILSPTPAGTVTPFATPLFQALAPVPGTASGGLGFAVYAFNTPLQALYGGGGINADGPLAGGAWEFTAWSDGIGDTLTRWFSSNGVGLAPGNSIVFDLFSPFGPVPAGAFPDPSGADESFGSVDDSAGDFTSVEDSDTAVPEPSTWGLMAVSAAGFGLFLRRKAARARGN